MLRYLVVFGLFAAAGLQADDFSDDFGDALSDGQDAFAVSAPSDLDQSTQHLPSTDQSTAALSPAASSPQTRAQQHLEELNRQVHDFNEFLDRLVLKPVAEGYDDVTPAPVNRGVTNFFSNIGELPSALNALLQGKPLVAGDNLFRFLINSTFGVLGFFDVASGAGIGEHKEDFGQTLAVWGAPSGPYLVLPFFGPSTFRDAHGRVADGFVDPVNAIHEWPPYVATRTLDIVDGRADLLKAEEMISGDRYTFIKNAYLQNRDYLINDGQVQDTFDTGEFEDDADWLEE